MKDKERSEWDELAAMAMESNCSKQAFRRWLESKQKEDVKGRREAFHLVKQGNQE